MTTLRTKVAIIGAGSAGMRAYREVTKTTDDVLLIEDGPYGTTCARVGCMPSKLLIAAAEAAHAGQHTQAMGVTYDAPTIDGAAVMDRVRRERDRFVGFVEDTVEDWPEHQRIRARATFEADNRLALSDGRTVEAEAIIIATGSRPNILPFFENFGDRLIVNDDVFSWDDLPGSVAVFGAGVIGLELGQALHRLGVKVSLFGRDNLVGPLSDPEVLARANALFADEFDFHPHADVQNHRRTQTGVALDLVTKSGMQTLEYDFALIATGRRPNVDTLGLETTSLEMDARGVPLFDVQTGQCGTAPIFIAGDANNIIPLLHEAADEGMCAGYNAAHYPDIRRFVKSAPISVVFSDPQIMMVGETHRALTERHADFVVGEVDWSDQGRARVMGVNKGLLRVYGDRITGSFLGAEMIGPRAEHLAHLLAWSLQSHLTVGEMLDRPFYHPVIEEGLRTALRILNANMQMGAMPPSRCIDCGPGA
ncbi:dihydrolipoyl dehydrogenase [Pseudooctadecabacter jejudonensis]|uniref:Dihydrolipoyl dehydrogenase n=1 Tax=Pseudooctadecabacter jejudonensis TaxID=1391910 RepID=A0A1Y5TJU5_9RHOB|nr:dihydrolipoyl dehydrogenase [Pseudooctadecabacter jejudonensis]SLN63636.1 Dihydrolipoyl dehydrogenase [Pseudooctadecabacter jejudonensis]